MATNPYMSVAPKMTPKPLLPAKPLMSLAPNMSAAPTVYYKNQTQTMTPAPVMSAAPKPQMSTAPYGGVLNPNDPAAIGGRMMTPAKPQMTPAPMMSTVPKPMMTPAPQMSYVPKPTPTPQQVASGGDAGFARNNSVPAPTPTAPDQNAPGAEGTRAMDEARKAAAGNQTPTPPAPPTKTSDGKNINPATGGVSEPSAAEQAAAKAAEAYQGTLTQTPEEIAAQQEADTLAESYGLSRNANQNRAVAMPFITGAAANLERSYNLNAGTLEQRMARLQAARIAAQGVNKFQLERADKAVEREQTVADDEKKAQREAEKQKAEGGFTLGENQRRYDAQGNLIASGPEGSADGGDYKFQKVGNDLYRVEDDGSLTKVTPQEATEKNNELVKTALSSIDELVTFDEAGNATLRDTAKFAIGKSSIFNFIPGTKGADAKAKIQQLKDNLSLSMIPYLKGTGAISDAEQRMLAGAASSISTSLSEEGFANEIAKIRRKLTEVMNGQGDMGNWMDGGGVDTSDPDFQSLRNDPDLKGFSDEQIWETLGKPKVGSGTNNAQLRVKLPNGKTHEGGSASWRNNNPLNIKNGAFASKYGASQGSAATDGGNFAAFPSVETGMKAARDLLRASSYTTLPLEQAMRRWSGNGYGADVAPANLRNKKTGQMTDAELNTLIEYMRKREGWKEGKIYA